MFSGGKAGGGDSHPQKPSLLTAMRIQNAVEGVLVPIGAGTFRIAGILIGYFDFKAIAHTSTQQVGGKGASPQPISQTTYTYQAATLRLLVLAPDALPIEALGQIWGTQGKSGTQKATEVYVLAAATQNVVHAADYTQDRGVSVSTNVNHNYTDYGDPAGLSNITFVDQVPMKKVTGAPNPGEYKQVGGTYTFNAADIGKTVSISYSYNLPAADTSLTAPPTLKNFTVFKGTRPQTAWAYLTTNHPADAMAYAGLALAANDKEDLGGSATLENDSFECICSSRVGGGNMDASIDTIVKIVTTDPHTGCGLPVAMLGDLTAAVQYTFSNGLFFSPVFLAESTAADALAPILDAANCAPVVSGKQLLIVPYGDKTAAGNGQIFTPDTSPRYDLTEADFICADGEEPIKVTDNDVKNVVTIEFLDRANDYNPRPIPHQDSGSIFRLGRMTESKRTYHFICDALVAARVANHCGLRAVHIASKTYEFMLSSARYALLEPVRDMVTVPSRLISGNAADTDKIPVRLKSIEEDEETGELKIEAEPFPFGAAGPTLYTKQNPNAFSAGKDADPGNVNTPVIFEATDRLSLSGGYELWLGISGADPNWGGATIWGSADGSSYKYTGLQSGKARMGVLAANLAANADPDVIGTLDVDLAMSGGTLLSGSADDRDNFRTLCWVEGAVAGQYELISYKTATLVSGNRYQLTDLRRGVYGTPVLAHTIGQKFLRLDQAVNVIAFDAQAVGKTAHFKLASFNLYGLRSQALPGLTDYTYAITGRFHNFLKFVASNCTVDSIGTGGPPFTAATVRCYGKVAGVPTVGADITFQKDDGTTQTHVADTQAGKALATHYWALLNPVSWTIYLLTSYAAVVTAMGWGHIVLGDTMTPAAGGGGGTSGGGGGGFGGGGGGGGGAGGNLN